MVPQEILGDLHNLFGDNHSAVVSINEQGETHFDEMLTGDTVADVLRYVNLMPLCCCKPMSN